MQNNAPNEKKKIFYEVESEIRHPIFEQFIIPLKKRNSDRVLRGEFDLKISFLLIFEIN